MKNSVCWNQDQGPGKYDFCTLSGDNSHKMCAYRFRCDKGNDYPSGKNAYSKKQYRGGVEDRGRLKGADWQPNGAALPPHA